jgi:dTDP-4-dehydrorhamnose 3,5-epimerase
VIFFATTLQDARLIDIERKYDNRGYFARTMCRTEFSSSGLVADFVQINHSYTRRRGTLRGMHYQSEPHSEAKLVRCVRGLLYHAILDLRPHSPTYLRWEGFELSADGGRMLYIPEGFAHGTLTLSDDVDLIYHASHFHTPTAECGLRFDDPQFAIQWPLPVAIISDRDRSWPPFSTRELSQRRAEHASRARLVDPAQPSGQRVTSC